MSLGSLYLRLRQSYASGLRAVYAQRYLLPQIFETPPILSTEDRSCEIHVMTCAKDWIELIWALKSFYYSSRREYALCIHDDGSLGMSRIAELQRHFPKARILERTRADADVLPSLLDFPKCLVLRRTNKLSLKIFDFHHYLRSDRMLLLDSDVLFFQKPIELLRRIETPAYLRNSVNGDVKSCYTATAETALRFSGVKLVDRFNSGVGLIHRDSVQLQWIEEFLNFPHIIGHFWLIEQTIYALLSSRYGCELLPDEYSVHLGVGTRGAPMRHYVGAVRHLLYAEGIPQLLRSRSIDRIGAR